MVLLFDVSVNQSTCIYFKSCEVGGKDCSHTLLQAQGGQQHWARHPDLCNMLQPLHPQKNMWNPKWAPSRGTKQPAGSHFQQGGVSGNVTPLNALQSDWFQKLTKPFLSVLLVLIDGTIWPCSFSYKIQLLLTVSIPGTCTCCLSCCLEIFRSLSCLCGIALLLPTLQIREIPTVSFSLKSEKSHFHPHGLSFVISKHIFLLPRL